MLKIDEKYFKNPKKYIPKGFYCYDNNGNCPFWSLDEDKPYMSNGYCSYLKQGDWDFNHIGLLWDMCKECDVNEPDL